MVKKWSFYSHFVKRILYFCGKFQKKYILDNFEYREQLNSPKLWLLSIRLRFSQGHLPNI
jgi:hypothetical protein